jgi:hypothetical protein
MVFRSEEDGAHALVDIVEGHGIAITEDRRLNLDWEHDDGDVGCWGQLSATDANVTRRAARKRRTDDEKHHEVGHELHSKGNQHCVKRETQAAHAEPHHHPVNDKTAMAKAMGDMLAVF